MAKEVKLRDGQKFNFERSSTSGRGTSVYPWDRWFTGKLITLERSVFDNGIVVDVRDYDVPTNAMVPRIHTAARRRYKVVQVSRFDADGDRLKDALIVQSRDMTREEREIEDLQRIEDKKKAKEQRVNRKARMSS